MCGILGIIDRKNKAVPAVDLTDGLTSLSHRGPDDTGFYQGSNFTIGHRRLAIFDLSEKGRQPMTYRGRVLVFNGAIYNFPELKKELIALGHQFQTETDTEVILAAYVQWGPPCVSRFNGQWAFAIFDPSNNQIFCSRDRFGIKPFYYSTFGGRFHFASEIKAFKKFPAWQSRLNRIRSYEFLAYGLHDHTEETLYQGVKQLAQGSHLIYDLDVHAIRIERYYHLQDNLSAEGLSFSQARERFFDLLQDAVRLRLRSDVPLGSALSGGLDSSSVVSLMKQLLGKDDLTTVSACFPEVPAIDETPYIDELQRQVGFRSLRISPSRAQFQQLEKLVTWHQDEPLSGPGVIAQFLVFQRAAEAGIKVMLDGQGADEILGGYQKFFAPYFKMLLRRKPLAIFPALWNFISLHHWSYVRIWDKLSALNSKTKGLIPAWIHSQFRPDSQSLYRPLPFRSMQELSIQLITGMGLPALLHYEDRNAMAHGVESRLPFLDHRLVEFCLSLPDDYRIDRARRKVILREALKDYLPPSIYHRYDKLGFAVPEWSPTQEQLLAGTASLQRAAAGPILSSNIDWTKLPTGVKHRVYYFSKFLESWEK